MGVVWIAGAGTDIGKTYIAAALLHALRPLGHAPDALKPVASGMSDDAAATSDPGILLQALGRPIDRERLDHIAPWRFKAPLSPPLAARMEGKALHLSEIVEFCRARAETVGERPLLIETAGGVMSPIDDRHTMLDLMASLPAPAVLVGGSYLGAISHTLTALTVLRGRGIAVPVIAISESAGDAPALDETLAALAAFAGEAAIVPFPRGGLPAAAAEILAACLPIAGPPSR